MQDDVFMLSNVGWLEAVKPREIVQVKDDKGKKKWPEPHDIVVGKRRYKSDLLPAAVLQHAQFAKELPAIEPNQAELSTLEAELSALVEEHCGEDGLLAEAAEGEGDKLKLTEKGVKARRKELGKGKDDADERKALDDALALLQNVSSAKSDLKDAETDLETKTLKAYGQLSEKVVQQLVVEEKWFTALDAAIQGELDRVSQTLTTRVTELATRYAAPLPELTTSVDAASARVDAHLKRMGLTW